MSHKIYSHPAWRSLPRTGLCIAAEFFGAENCAGPLHRHHVKPLSEGGDDLGPTILVCAKHHPMIEAIGRKLRKPRWKNCPHTHRTRESREQCERKLNRI